MTERLSHSDEMVIVIEQTASLQEALEREAAFDAIMAGLWLSDAFGFEIIDRLKERCRSPIIVLGSSADSWLAIQALRHGAQDYLSREELHQRSLVRSILFSLERQRREAALVERTERLTLTNERLERLAETDPLTLVLNRRGLERAMFDRRIPRNRSSCVMLVDCDDFKLINDIHGHAAGDDVLRNVANRLAACLRSSDTISRVGGDEFLIVLPDTSEEEALAIADRARRAIKRQPIATAAGSVSTTVSIGICAMPASGGSVEQALRQLHAGLLESKQTGKDCASLSTDLPSVAEEKFAVAK
jgi:two-component system, cell cycle response regulator